MISCASLKKLSEVTEVRPLNVLESELKTGFAGSIN